ncbi:MAG: GspE/PulE family protein [Candidatus Komeilibacteria bacterium]|nr:GspE/PulE family protein [Candidatus Komeilibacteria bacterium]
MSVIMTDDHNQNNVSIASDDTKATLHSKLQSMQEQNIEVEAETEAKKRGYSYINLKGYPISADAIALIDKEKAESLQLLSFYYTGEEVRFGAIDPGDPTVREFTKQLAEKLNANASTLLISPLSFQIGLKAYDKVPRLRKIETGVQITEEELNQMQARLTTYEDLQKELDKANTSEIISLIIASALKFDTSDIHIEAEEKEIKLRLRVDGELATIATMPKTVWPKIDARVKLLSNLKLNITSEPQDGRFTISLTDDKIDVRVSTLPTSYGESIVMRLLKSSSVGLQFEQLGLRGRSFKDLEYNIARPNGMIITTGPTGSGKTTTLYAILNKLNDEATKIITLEDPIEYKLKGINQSQVAPDKGYNFAGGLRSILRQDPDIIMVGEIRDLETAEVAINAALTGHLMVSTIHTNSAAGAIPRLLAMGVKPFLLAPSINAIIGQRLLRRLCKECRREVKLDNDEIGQRVRKLLLSISETSGDRPTEEQINSAQFYQANPDGCEKCHAGYKGRVGVYEVMAMNEDVEKMVLSGNVSEYDAQAIAIKGGMVTMVQDGLLKAMEGITSVTEVFDKTE